MGILDKLKGELIDIIEWTEPTDSQILAYRFSRYQNEIKNGAKLTVREGQSAVFVNEGQMADVFRPGMYTLDTKNLPILGTLKGWKYGFNSPFKAEVYFVSMKQWTDQKWGTQNPVMMRDPEFGPVRIRAFGTYAMKIADPATFLRQLVATDPSFESYEISKQLRNTIVSRFVDVIGQAKIPVLDLAGNYEKMSKFALEKIGPDLATMGLALTLFYIENISLPPEVEEAIDKRSKIGVLGNLQTYTQYQMAESIPIAAQNPGGVAGLGMGMAAGVTMGNQMATQLGGAMNAPQQQSAAASAGPPPLPGSAAYFVGVGGKQEGPFDMGTLASYVQSGQLSRTSLVWKQGMAAWVAADSVPELKPLFAHQPPPLPPSA